jgi:hypothetical protein
VKEIATGRIGQAAGKYADTAPLATTCCNACRVCVTTNAVGLAIAAATAGGVAVANLARRLRRGSAIESANAPHAAPPLR